MNMPYSLISISMHSAFDFAEALCIYTFYSSVISRAKPLNS
ncbi:hypothetical protein SAMN05421739_104312 [Pontibacter chinhatensis]|uniref:Uncharacterized protein n=1 Tax=Pontibacter chinhatensis TaxID=1436961 RepID=A0A1I2VR07_9BACT|nr:hypothetical protein SAMN05421739_104312 [Pontibacter chinhatensis]